jgi:hypothetical protein
MPSETIADAILRYLESSVVLSATMDGTVPYGFIANQIMMAAITNTIAPQSTGALRFELPLRGESLAAWLNFSSIGGPAEMTQYRNQSL